MSRATRMRLSLRARLASGRGRPHGSDRGALAVEFALIVPLLVVLLFGVIDFGFVFGNWLAVRDGSREGAREAAVAETGGDTSCTIVGAGLMTNATREVVCLTKSATGLEESDVRVKIVIDSYVAGERLAMCVQHPADSVTGIFSPFLDDRTVRSKVEMRIEELSDPAIGSMQETAHDGSDWSWCSL